MMKWMLQRLQFSAEEEVIKIAMLLHGTTETASNSLTSVSFVLFSQVDINTLRLWFCVAVIRWEHLFVHFVPWGHPVSVRHFVYFKLRRVHRGLCEIQTSSPSRFVIQSVKAPVPISMIISHSAQAKTSTMMQFISPLLSGAETLGPAEGWRVGEGGSRNLSVLATLSRGPCLPSSASAKHIRFRVSEHLEASGVLHETLSQSQSALKYFVEEIKVPKDLSSV